MNKEHWIQQKLIDNAIKEWSEEGRTEEQIYPVTSFMTGRGLKMAKEIFDVGMSAQESIEKITESKLRHDIKEHNKIIRERLKYCLKQNEMSECKNCGLNESDDLIDENI